MLSPFFRHRVRPVQKRRLVLPLAFAALFLMGGATVGCGGGGGDNGGQSQLSSTATRAAVIRVVRQTRTLPALLGAVTTALDSAGRKVPTRAGRTRQETSLTYNPNFGLYYSTSQSLTAYKVNFFTDAAGTQSAGDVTASLSGTSSAQARFNVTGGAVPVEGTLTLKSGGSQTIQTTGTVRLTRTGESITPDLSTDANGETTGNLTVSDGSGTIHYNGLVARSDGQFLSKLEYSGVTGTVTQQTDGSGVATLGTRTNRYEAIYNANGAGTLTRFDGTTYGTQEVITQFDTL